MKAGLLFQRDGLAQRRMLAAAAELAKRLGAQPKLLERLRVQRGDPAVRAMQEREAIADLLEETVKRIDALAQPAAMELPKEEVNPAAGKAQRPSGRR